MAVFSFFFKFQLPLYLICFWGAEISQDQFTRIVFYLKAFSNLNQIFLFRFFTRYFVKYFFQDVQTFLYIF